MAVYPTLPLKAAALMQSLATNRAVSEGNDRLTWLAVVVFLNLNGGTPKVDDDEAFDLLQNVTAGHVELEEVARRLKVDGGA